MDKKKYVNLAVEPKTRDILKLLAKKSRTPLYLFIEDLAQEAKQKILPKNTTKR